MLFKEIKNENILTRNFFNETNINIPELNMCHQGLNYNLLRRPRQILREHRLHTHYGYRNSPRTQEEILSMNHYWNSVKNDIFVQFSKWYSQVQVTVPHFQLRKNLKFLNKHEIVYFRTFGLEMLNLITMKKLTLLIIEETDSRNIPVSFDIIEVDDILYIALGKINGDLYMYTIKRCDIKAYNKLHVFEKADKILKIDKTTIRVAEPGDSQIVNFIKFIEHDKKLLTTHNDGKVNVMDLNCYNKMTTIASIDHPINHIDFNNSKNLASLAADDNDIFIYDLHNNLNVHQLKGHLDHNFVCRFKPNNDFILATGSQDNTCRIWDIRGKSGGIDNNRILNTLYGKFDAIGDVLFLDDDLICFAENLDFVHLYNLKENKLQTLEYFGYMTGIAYHKELEGLFMGLYESTGSGLIRYDKIRANVVEEC